jgi:hypothetical protein
LALGSNGQVLKVNTSTATGLEWSSGYINNTVIDSKGDLMVWILDNTPAKLATGTNCQILTVNTATPTGLEWSEIPTPPEIEETIILNLMGVI